MFLLIFLPRCSEMRWRKSEMRFKRKEKEDDAANAAEDTTMLCIVDNSLDLLTP